ncbi:unnamed protein product [Polarella glacialis]|uniref:Peptidase C14 caspase domain-containing protein n=1 Tax=Polarella glacialis TaxID=89957 RepID=A0A813LBC4_POLGL|nr:unnamed protein product [Polarella glacialis]
MNGAVRAKNRQVNGQSNYKRAAPIFHQEDHRINMLIVALDYKNSGQTLRSTEDAKHLEDLAKQSGVQNLVALYDNRCTKDAVRTAIKKAGLQCGVNDYFIFYFAGHATSLRETGEQASHELEEAFVLVDSSGRASQSSLLADEDFSNLVLDSFKPETRILILTDCGHPVPLVNITRARWGGRQVIFIAGTEASENVPGEDSKRGMFTHALLLGIDKLSKVGRDNYSVGMLFNALLLEDELVFRCKQDVEIQSAPDCSPDTMAWPIVPSVGYQAPLTRCTGPGGVLSNASVFGISPALLQHVVQEALNAPVSIEEYLAQVQGQAAFQFKACRACSAGCSTTPCTLQ